jgi:prepilin-type N-terminal cleavage/methylation domain-containing protein
MALPPSLRTRRGFTLVEAMICTVLVGIILVAAISTVGATKRAQKSAADRAAANLLAADLLAEVASKAYSEPSGSGALGVDSGETPSSRSGLDDVDDFAAYDESPPTDRAGNTIPGFEKWSRFVRVEYVSAASPEQVAVGETGAKRITVTVTSNGTVLSTRTTIRTAAADQQRTVTTPGGASGAGALSVK